MTKMLHFKSIFIDQHFCFKTCEPFENVVLQTYNVEITGLLCYTFKPKVVCRYILDSY